MIDAQAVAERLADPDKPAVIIGEIGSNFDGSMSVAREMIDMVAEAGCDLAKFQIFRADDLVRLDSYAHSVLKPLELPREWVPELVAYCAEKGVGFCASPFDLDALDTIVRADGIPIIKIASPEIHDVPLLRASAGHGVPLLISTGMASLTDIEHALAVVAAAGAPPVCLLHCVSIYPAEPSHMHIRMMQGMADAFGRPVGLSDHSIGTAVPIAAVALGARVIEKHVTLNRDRTGPDHNFALEPGDLRAMVDGIREVEAALGDRYKQPIYGAEQVGLNNKALVSRCAIAAGQALTWDVVCVKRAMGGILPRMAEAVIGRRARVDIAADAIITWEML